MSKNIFKDMKKLYSKYGFLNSPLTLKRLQFRIKTLQLEEYNELEDALENKNSEEIVDALIDIIVIAAGTLELLKVDTNKAWNEVLKANMNKHRGVKSTRPESGGFDLAKPDNWKSPSHKNNLGLLPEIFKVEK